MPLPSKRLSSNCKKLKFVKPLPLLRKTNANSAWRKRTKMCATPSLWLPKKTTLLRVPKPAVNVHSKTAIRYLANISRRFLHVSKKPKLSLKRISSRKSKRRLSLSLVVTKSKISSAKRKPNTNSIGSSLLLTVKHVYLSLIATCVRRKTMLPKTAKICRIG